MTAGKSRSTIVSAADIGTNTIKITHAAIKPDGTIIELYESANTIRLGKGIETTGRVSPDRIDACLGILTEAESIGRQFGSAAFIGVATEALRIATNGKDLLDRISTETAWQINLIPGEEEARLTYVGLKDHLPESEDVTIVDIGGGSSEVIQVRNDEVAASMSLPLGSGRLADTFFSADPPGIEALMNACEKAKSRLDDIDAISDDADTILFAGGNGVFIQQLVEQLYPGAPLDSSTIERLILHLASTPSEDTAKRLGIVQERARVLPAGAAIAMAFLLRTTYQTVVGVPSGIRIGLIKEFAARQ